MKLISIVLITFSLSAFGNGGSTSGNGGGPGAGPVLVTKSIGGDNPGGGGGPGVVLGEDVVDVRLENGDVYDVDYLKDKFGDWVKKEGTLLKLDTRIKIRDVQTAAGEIIAVQ